MSCEVAALPFQAHANYGTWSIDFAEMSIFVGDALTLPWQLNFSTFKSPKDVNAQLLNNNYRENIISHS